MDQSVLSRLLYLPPAGANRDEFGIRNKHTERILDHSFLTVSAGNLSLVPVTPAPRSRRERNLHRVMSNKHCFLESTAEYNARLARRFDSIPGMNLKRWKLFRSILLSMAILLFTAFTILQGADATAVTIPAIITAALVAGIELNELLAVWVETQAKYRNRREDEDK